MEKGLAMGLGKGWGAILLILKKRTYVIETIGAGDRTQTDDLLHGKQLRWFYGSLGNPLKSLINHLTIENPSRIKQTIKYRRIPEIPTEIALGLGKSWGKWGRHCGFLTLNYLQESYQFLLEGTALCVVLFAFSQQGGEA